jgi:hypothetical protein
MKNDTGLRVALPGASAQNGETESFQGGGSVATAGKSGQNGGTFTVRPYYAAKKAPVVGTKTVESSSLKASSKPRVFHLYIGNLDLDATPEKICSYVEANNVPVRILSCEIVHSSRFKEERALAAHVAINALDKDNAFSPLSWPCDVVIRPWRRLRQPRPDWGDDNDESKVFD